MRMAVWSTLCLVLAACGRIGFDLSPLQAMDGGPIDSLDASALEGSDATAFDARIPCTDWWDEGWAQRRLVSVSRNLTTERLEGFPLLVVLDPSTVDYANAGPSGASLRFVTSDSTTIIPHEIEHWQPGDRSYVWLRMTVEASGTSPIWMYLDNPDAADGSTAEVWQGYESVHHLAGDLRDATDNGHTGAGSRPPSHNSGRIGLGAVFDGNESFELPNETSFDFADSLTVSLWFRVGSPGWHRRWETLVAKGDHAYRMHRDSYASALEFGTTSASIHDNMGGSDPVDDGVWHHAAMVFDGNRKTLYVDGLQDSWMWWEKTIDNTSHPVSVGENNEVTGRFFEGEMDELRITPTPRSAAWIAAEAQVASGDVVRVGEVEICP